MPAEIAVDVDNVVTAIRDAAEQQGLSSGDDIRIIRPRGKEMGPGGLDAVFLIVGSGAAWFTKKWFDTFVWPKLEALIKKPSDQAVDFVISKVPSGDPNAAGQET